MTNETRNRIRAYMEELPFMKEKIFGALLMFVVAAVVVVSATYAWVTLSRSPEVSEITTTLAANGALEIALSNPEGTAPQEFDFDESLEDSPSVLVSNLQWGNLVNLSDAAYGIDNLALRPAQLNTTSLLTSPLWGAVYGSDGRITNLDSSYAYAKYNGSQFLTSNEYGVRAIATYKAEISDATQLAYNEKVQAVITAHTTVNQTYSAVAPKFSALGTMISKYAQTKLDGEYTDLAPYISDMLPLYRAVRDAMEAQKSAYVALANLQNYLFANKNNLTYSPLSWDDLYKNRSKYNVANADANSTDGNIALVGLTQFITDYEKLLKDIEHLELYYTNYKDNGAPYYWSGYRMDGETKVTDSSVRGYTLSDIVAHLIDYSSMTIDLDNTGTETKVMSLGMDNAGSLVSANGKERKVYAYNGILYRLEQSSIDEAYRINGNAACTIKVTYMMSITVYGKAYTKAAGACTFMENFTKTQGDKLVANDAVAEDTYGLAIDLWVRTNVEETCLTLEGATSTDVQGNIVSYDGINRIWGATGEAVLTTDSTTQGGGSCYIYYADTPEDMARSLELLNAMKVAFVDSNGDLLAVAEMDTVNYWAVNGRITVPLVLDSSQSPTTYTYTDEMNTTLIGHAVTTLYADTNKRITAIVYLDGTRLTNDHVLAAAEIEGSLNIQFGSSTEIKTVGSNELIDDTRTVTAIASPTELNYDTAQTKQELTTSITVNIEGEGEDPDTVTAFFVRAINSTQGSREETMTFTKQTSGAWTCDYVFAAPGTYWLRQVRLDGVDYTLADPQKVEVIGFALDSVTWSELDDQVVLRTSDNSHSTAVTVQFATNEQNKRPASVQARFVRDDGNTVNVPLTYNANGDWVGTGTFTASGVYQLQYLVVDGRYIDLALTNGSYRTMDLSLGMYVTVTDLSGGLVQDYEEGKSYPKEVAVKVFNNAGTALEELTDLTLFYSNGASSTNTTNTPLTWDWDELNGSYIGTLPIVSPGRYQFSSVKLGDQYLTLAKENPPVYTVISPDPPIYDTNSAVSEAGVQFVPLTNNAKIDGIVIENAASASASAVVYHAETDSYYPVSMEYSGNDAWYVNLPTYNGAQTGTDSEGNPIYAQEQDGQWSLAAILLWDCYDENSVLHAAADPILWVASGSVGANYLSELTNESGTAVTADAVQDFSKLTTTVSAKVNVTMYPGAIDLGGSDVAFGHAFQPAETGMSVALTDGAGRVIPEKYAKVTLTLGYTGNNDTKYGYKVSGYNADYEIKLDYQPAEANSRTVSSASANWTYVGVYSVKKLEVVIGETTLTYTPDSGIGVPKQYTVTTAGPTVDNITLDKTSVKQNTKAFGKAASGDVTGTFLEKHDLDDTYVTINLIGESGAMNNAVLDGLSAKLILTHKSGTSQTHGNYTFSGDTGYQNLELAMTDPTSSGTYYAPASQTLLAGVYTAQVQITVGGTTETVNLDNIEVWSMKPDVKITGVASNVEGDIYVNKNTDKANNHLTANAETFGPVANRYGDYYAVVYMAYERGASAYTHSEEDNCGKASESGSEADRFANYTMPEVSFSLNNSGGTGAVMKLTGNGIENVELTESAPSKVAIGSISEDTNTDYSHKFTKYGYEWTCTYEYTTETAATLGTKTIETVTSTVGNATYTRTLANPITISQPNKQNPELIWDAKEGVSIEVTYGGTTYNSTTTAIPIASELKATVTTDYGYHTPVMVEPDGVSDWKLVSSTETKKVYTFRIMDDVTLTASATKYPVITFSSANGATVNVTATVDGGTEPIESGITGVKPGAVVTVTATTVREDGYCKPRLAQPSGVTGWTANEGDFVSTYTFTMPNKPVSLAPPTTTAMYKLTWDLHNALRFVLKDGNAEFDDYQGSYVMPGNELSIKLVATGGINPKLQPLPDNVIEGEISVEEANYTYVMNSDLHLTATAESYPLVILDNEYATFEVYIVGDTDPLTYDSDASDGITGVSVKPGRNVRVVLTAIDGRYKPRMTAPSGVTLNVIDESDWSAEYTFKMPYAEVDARSCIKATEMTTVKLSANNVTASMSYTGQNGVTQTLEVKTGTSSVKVKPDTTVSVTATANTDYYKPTISGKSDGDWETTQEFTVGDTEMTLAASATAMYTLTLSASNATLSVNYVGYRDAEGTISSGSVKVKPGSTVEATATADSTNKYYITDAEVTANGTALTGTGNYVTREYSFAMNSNVTLKVAAAAYKTVSWSVTSHTLGVMSTVSSVTANGVAIDSGAQVAPGTTVIITVTSSNRWYAANWSRCYYKPTVTGSYTSWSSTTGSKSAKYTCTLEFTMGTSNISLTFDGEEE